MIDKITTKWRWIHWLRRFLYWIIPIIILYLISQKIDITEFKHNIAKTKPWMVALGICYYPTVILIGALRWRLLLIHYNQSKAKLSYILKHYWIGLALGFFTPASLGWDSYRIIVSGRYFGQYSLNTAVIFVEKLMALITCMSMIILLYPMVPITKSLEIDQILRVAYILFFSSFVFLFLINFALRNRMLSILLERFEVYFSEMLKKIGSRLGVEGNTKDSNFPFRAMIKPLTKPKQISLVLILSFGIQIVAAGGNQIFFKALSYDLSFIINLFISPIFFFVFLLPISFGSLGIREGAYILLYGLFGIPVEIALLVSFFNLSGLLFNSLVGGSLMLFSKVKGKTLLKIDIES